MEFFKPKRQSAYDAIYEAQRIAFAPFVFQAARVLRNTGILSAIEKSGKTGATLEKLTEETKQSRYALRVLLEAGLATNLVHWDKNKTYTLTKVSYFLLHDEMTRVNMDFMHDICYQGAFYLDEAIAEGKPAGLKELGSWATIYEGLSKLKPHEQKSWFDFDHFYSDSAFPAALPIVLKPHVKKVMDVGGNTGKWALACTQHREDIKVTILDLPGQLNKALDNAKANGVGDRVDGHAMNLLEGDAPFPAGYDVIWMSQFLDCFSEDEIVRILKRAAGGMDDRGDLYILETYWDRQQHEPSAYCLIQTSLYFTVMANGNSRMYHSDDMRACVEQAGLKVVEEIDNLGISHTLFRCKLAR